MSGYNVNLIAAQLKTVYVDGLYVDANDLLAGDLSDRNALGEALASIIGTVNAQMNFNPVTLTVAGMVITVGGTNQWLFVQGRIADTVPATTETVPANTSGEARVDLLCVKYTLGNIDGTSRVVQQPNGSDADNTIYDTSETVTWEYVEGTPGAGQPATPSGYEIFAIVDVPTGATTVTPVIQFSTIASLFPVPSVNGLTGPLQIVGDGDITVTASGSTISIAVTSAVTSVNSQSGAINIAGGTGITVAATGGVITVNCTIPQTSVNAETGAITIEGGSGISFTETSPGSKIWVIAATGASTTVQGLSGAITLAGTGILSTIVVSGQEIVFEGPASVVTSVNGLINALNIVGGTGVGVTASGSTITISSIVTSLNGQYGTLTVESSDGTVTVNTSAGLINLTAGTGSRVGTTYMVPIYFAGSPTATVALGFDLDAGSWHVAANFRGASTGGNATLVGSGATWLNSDSTAGNAPNIGVMQIVGSATAGQNPSVTVTFTGGYSETGTLVLHVSRYA